MQDNQPTHFIETWATKGEYKFNDEIKHCFYTDPLPVYCLGRVLNETLLMCTSIHTIAIFKIYPKNKS